VIHDGLGVRHAFLHKYDALVSNVARKKQVAAGYNQIVAMLASSEVDIEIVLSQQIS
jgi:hypothetical protein